jgi:histidyl-tRNA synthetase
MKVAKLLWQANISAEYAHQDNPKFKRQLDDVLERKIPFMIVFGEDELKKGVVKVKDMNNHTEVEVSENEMVKTLLSFGCTPVNASSNNNSFLKLLSQSNTICDEH